MGWQNGLANGSVITKQKKTTTITMEEVKEEELKEEEVKEEKMELPSQQMERELGLPIPAIVDTYDDATRQCIGRYLQQLTSIERKAYTIGYEHLGSSFHILKSNGFNEWKKREEKT